MLLTLIPIRRLIVQHDHVAGVATVIALQQTFRPLQPHTTFNTHAPNLLLLTTKPRSTERNLKTIFANVLYFILHATTSYFQAMRTPAETVINSFFANVLGAWLHVT